MKKKGGAILIGTWHSGENAAKETIAELEKHGIRKGDLVGVERSKQDFLWLKMESNPAILKKTVENIDRRLADFDKRASEATDAKTKEYWRLKKEAWTEVRENAIFDSVLFNFLFSKKVKFLPLESYPRAIKTSDLLAEQSIDEFHGRKVSKAQKRIARFMEVPIREKFYRRQLQANNPKFVLIGAGHLAAVKRMIPYEKTVNLSKEGLAKRVISSIGVELVRAQYRATREWQKAKRRIKRARRI
jgi:hypothetical protein